MIEQKNTTGSVEEQAPATTEASTTTAPTTSTSAEASISHTATSTEAKAPATISTEASITALPDGYLANGSMLDAEGVMRPEYLEEYPQALAKALRPLSAASFQRAFLTRAKEANRKKTAYNIKKNTAQEMVVQAMKLTVRKKDPAPALLLDMMKLAAASVKDPESFSAMYTHLEAICAYLLMN